MKIWQHRDMCLSLAKINTYRQRREYDIMLKWIKELREKLNDLEQHYIHKKGGFSD